MDLAAPRVESCGDLTSRNFEFKSDPPQGRRAFEIYGFGPAHNGCVRGATTFMLESCRRGGPRELKIPNRSTRHPVLKIAGVVLY